MGLGQHSVQNIATQNTFSYLCKRICGNFGAEYEYALGQRVHGRSGPSEALSAILRPSFGPGYDSRFETDSFRSAVGGVTLNSYLHTIEH